MLWPHAGTACGDGNTHRQRVFVPWWTKIRGANICMRDSTKSEKRACGRPRAYDADDALSNATDAFWLGGYSGTSLDTLSDATGMNRPSLYAAFGDKHALYLPAGGEPRGCFLIGTAVVESKVDGIVRTRLAQGVKSFDRAFEKRIRRARQTASFPPTRMLPCSHASHRRSCIVLHCVCARAIHAPRCGRRLRKVWR